VINLINLNVFRIAHNVFTYNIFFINKFKMESNICIKQAICKDANEIHNINKKCLPVCYSHKEYVLYILDTKVILLKAICNDDIIGYALAKWYSDERLHIMSFAVLSEFRCKGVGKLLIDSIYEYGLKKKEFSQLTLYVQKSNKLALKFYENNNFKRDAYLKNYYGLKNHGYYMVSTISNTNNNTPY
jgi:ribosomal protein S18 acetylase RimI-like enzyme